MVVKGLTDQKNTPTTTATQKGSRGFPPTSREEYQRISGGKYGHNKMEEEIPHTTATMD